VALRSALLAVRAKPPAPPPTRTQLALELQLISTSGAPINAAAFWALGLFQGTIATYAVLAAGVIYLLRICCAPA
jgi:hypothetical protein